ncbi:hypothetical protein [Nonomuraea sp. PA05]|nr:hypothetical protein [Nonomuraea sp. PA05]
MSALGVPDQLIEPAAAASDPEQSVDARPVQEKKAAKGAEESAPR